MKEEYIVANDGLKIAYLITETLHPCACIQMIHGMTEHKERYKDFMEFLASKGFVVVISDLRGHGKSVDETYRLGHMGEINQMIDDQLVITEMIKKLYPNLPLYMFAHSMGTLIARNYLMEHAHEISKLVISGTVPYINGVGLGVFLAKWKMLFHGKYYYSSLLRAFSNGMSFSKDLSWLTYNQENIETYKKNPLCSFYFDCQSNKVLFQMTQRLHAYKKYQEANKEMSIFCISGIDDRTTGGEKGLKDTESTFRKIGYDCFKRKEYQHMKHEILNEDNKIEVYQDVVNFFQGE